MKPEIILKCKLCETTSEETLIFQGLFQGKQMLICVLCIAEFSVDLMHEAEKE